MLTLASFDRCVTRARSSRCSIPATGQKDRGLWGREFPASRMTKGTPGDEVARGVSFLFPILPKKIEGDFARRVKHYGTLVDCGEYKQ